VTGEVDDDLATDLDSTAAAPSAAGRGGGDAGRFRAGRFGRGSAGLGPARGPVGERGQHRVLERGDVLVVADHRAGRVGLAAVPGQHHPARGDDVEGGGAQPVRHGGGGGAVQVGGEVVIDF